MASSLSLFVIILAAIMGVLLAAYIRYKKTRQQVMVCPLRSNCEAVTHSEFSRFFGMPVELLGIAYYFVIAIAYLSLSFWPTLASGSVALALTTLTIAAFLFSGYLTFIQAFTLKQWCTWCLISAGLCTIIFATALVGSEHSFITILGNHYWLLLPLHLVGIVLGLGGASIADMFFFRFLKDFKISHEEAGILGMMSQVIWLGLAVLILTGIGLYLPQMEALNHTPKFLVKVVIVSVILVNGAFLNLKISPQLVHISFGLRHHHAKRELRHWRRLAFALGAVSATSWYSAFIFGLLPRSIPLSFWQLLGMYLGALAIAITGSQVMERLVMRRGARYPVTALTPAPVKLTTRT